MVSEHVVYDGLAWEVREKEMVDGMEQVELVGDEIWTGH
jgi:hypothetical protein